MPYAQILNLNSKIKNSKHSNINGVRNKSSKRRKDFYNSQRKRLLHRKKLTIKIREQNKRKKSVIKLKEINKFIPRP